MTADAVHGTLTGLTAAEAATLLREHGANTVRTRRANALRILLRQLRSPLLLLLAVTAVVSSLVGERSDAAIIGLILTASVGLGFSDEFRAARAADVLAARLAHDATVWRDGVPQRVPVTSLVPGDVIQLRSGDIVPADARLLRGTSLECDESALTGESLPVGKAADAELAMGTVVLGGTGICLVTETGRRTRYGRIAAGLAVAELPSAFQRGLADFSMLLVRVAMALTAGMLVTNLVLHRPLFDALLFSLAIAIGISPQLLPAVVSTSLARGARRLVQRGVLVKRLTSIEDLGDIEVLFTDKTGTLTEGAIALAQVLPSAGIATDELLNVAALCADVTRLASGGLEGNALDLATMAACPAPDGVVVTREPFNHTTRTAVAVVEDAGLLTRVVKGAPEVVLAGAAGGQPLLARARIEMSAGRRVIAVTRAPVDGGAVPTAVGLLLFADPPKPSAAASLQRLRALGIRVCIVTGDAAEVAGHLCSEFGLDADVVLSGDDVDALTDADLLRAIERAKVFARVSPEQKARIVRVCREGGSDVAFMGDGVNDALAMHAADVGISVDDACDVAREAADVILLEKDLDVLADAVVEGRRTFANTTKYVLMGTSSNFGNMFSAAAASAFLPFLPMLPSQVLLNGLLYDASQLAIPADAVDEEQLARPAEWNIAHIRRYMMSVGPLSSLFDFLTFAVMLQVFHAHAALFRSGWFVESLATQTLVVLVIRTSRRPFWRSPPSRSLLSAVLVVVAVGIAIPMSPLAGRLGFVALPLDYFGALVAMVLVYLALIDRAKAWVTAPATTVQVST